MCWNFVVYRSKISDVSELKTRLIDEWAQFDQSIVDADVSQRRRRLSTSVCVREAHFELGLRASGNLPVSYVLTGNLPPINYR